MYVLSGVYGLWDGNVRGYCPRVATSIKEAIEFAVDGWGPCYLKIVEKNYGRLYVYVYHHDGTNVLEVRELSDKGKELLLVNRVKTVIDRYGATRNVQFVRRYW